MGQKMVKLVTKTFHCQKSSKMTSSLQSQTLQGLDNLAGSHSNDEQLFGHLPNTVAGQWFTGWGQARWLSMRIAARVVYPGFYGSDTAREAM